MGASDELFMGFASEDEVLETAEGTRSAARHAVNPLGWLQLTGPAPMQERVLSWFAVLACQVTSILRRPSICTSAVVQVAVLEARIALAARASVCLGDLPDAPFGESGAGEGLR